MHTSRDLVHLVVDLVEEVHSMIGETREEDTERSLETGGSCSGLTNTYHLYFIIKFVLALISDSYDLLEIPWYCNLL